MADLSVTKHCTKCKGNHWSSECPVYGDVYYDWSLYDPAGAIYLNNKYRS